MHFGLGRKVAVAVAGAALVITAGCSGGGENPNQQNQALVVDSSFNLQTIDPARQFEFTGSLIDAQLYDTTLEFADGDVSEPVDGLCSYEMSDDQKVLTLTMADSGAKFSDGSEVTADDIVFSYQRLQGIGGNPSFFLDGVTVEKVDDQTITLTSEKPNPTLPYILPNSSLGIVNSDVVKENGGTTDDSDDAETFLNNESQGSGPYMIESYDPANEVVFTLNPEYAGDKPDYERVVLRNVAGETQKTNVQSGEAHFAMDLSPDQVESLDQNSVTVKSTPSFYSIYLYTTMQTSVDKTVADPKFREALRYGLDYEKLLALGGEGAQQLSSIVPNGFVGDSDPADVPAKDVEKAKGLLEESGYDGAAIPFNYASDQTVSGVPMDQFAQTLQAELKEVGIELDLKPAPSTTNLDEYRSGEQTMGLGSWGADYPDPENYLVFAPGNDLAERVQWSEGMSPDIEKLADEAVAAKTPEERDPAFSALYGEINKTGPFLSLVQPVRTVTASSEITEFTSNADDALIFASVK